LLPELTDYFFVLIRQLLQLFIESLFEILKHLELPLKNLEFFPVFEQLLLEALVLFPGFLKF